eukprot:jgi/Botrbrau1/19529/Bobra.0035s0025.1
MRTIARLLHSLTMIKYKILLKEPENKVIGKNDSFRVNVKFTDKMRRIKIPLPPVDEKKKVIEDVDKDRRYAIDAAIVRTMKKPQSHATSAVDYGGCATADSDVHARHPPNQEAHRGSHRERIP